MSIVNILTTFFDVIFLPPDKKLTRSVIALSIKTDILSNCHLNNKIKYKKKQHNTKQLSLNVCLFNRISLTLVLGIPRQPAVQLVEEAVGGTLADDDYPPAAHVGSAWLPYDYPFQKSPTKDLN